MKDLATKALRLPELNLKHLDQLLSAKVSNHFPKSKSASFKLCNNYLSSSHSLEDLINSSLTQNTCPRGRNERKSLKSTTESRKTRKSAHKSEKSYGKKPNKEISVEKVENG